MKKTITINILLITVLLTVVTISHSGDFVVNQQYCLKVDSSKANTIGDIAFLENNCSVNVTVKFCFGSYKCETSTSSTTVNKYDKKSIFYDKDEYNSMSLIAFACNKEVDRQDCYEAQKEFFKYKK